MISFELPILESWGRRWLNSFESSLILLKSLSFSINRENRVDIARKTSESPNRWCTYNDVHVNFELTMDWLRHWAIFGVFYVSCDSWWWCQCQWSESMVVRTVSNCTYMVVKKRNCASCWYNQWSRLTRISRMSPLDRHGVISLHQAQSKIGFLAICSLTVVERFRLLSLDILLMSCENVCTRWSRLLVLNTWDDNKV